MSWVYVPLPVAVVALVLAGACGFFLAEAAPCVRCLARKAAGMNDERVVSRLNVVALVLILAGVLGFLAWAALGQEPVTTTVTTVSTAATTSLAPTPTPAVSTGFVPEAPAWYRWIDRNVTPAIQFLGSHPIVAAWLFTYIVYFLLATAVIWALRVKFKNDRTECSFRVLIFWNLLEVTVGNVWKLQARYWPRSPIHAPWDPESGRGKIEDTDHQLPDQSGEKK